MDQETRTDVKKEEKRIAVIGIIIEDVRQAEQVNALLHQFGRYIIGRMGLPYNQRGFGCAYGRNQCFVREAGET